MTAFDIVVASLNEEVVPGLLGSYSQDLFMCV